MTVCIRKDDDFYQMREEFGEETIVKFVEAFLAGSLKVGGVGDDRWSMTVLLCFVLFCVALHRSGFAMPCYVMLAPQDGCLRKVGCSCFDHGESVCSTALSIPRSLP